MEQSETRNKTYPKQPIDFGDLFNRIKVLLPLVKGWNPDIYLAVNSAGSIVCGILNNFFPREIRTLSIRYQNDHLIVNWDNCGELRDKRVLVVADHFPNEQVLFQLENFLKTKQVLSLVKLVVLGKGVEYSCFPELQKNRFSLGKLMRLDKYLKVSKLIKRRTQAQVACKNNRVYLNNHLAKSSSMVKVGDEIKIVSPVMMLRKGFTNTG